MSLGSPTLATAARDAAGLRSATTASPGAGVRHDPRTRLLLEAPIARTLLRLAAPNVLVMLAQASVGLIETYFIGQLGTDAMLTIAPAPSARKRGTTAPASRVTAVTLRTRPVSGLKRSRYGRSA